MNTYFLTDPHLQTLWQNTTAVRLELSKYVDVDNGKDHLFLDDRSFPSGSLGWSVESKLYPPHDGAEWIKSHQKRYDLQGQVMAWHGCGLELDVKLLLLKRDFKRTIWSHRGWHTGFRGRDGYRGHAFVEAAYMSHISRELGTIGNATRSGSAHPRHLDQVCIFYRV